MRPPRACILIADDYGLSEGHDGVMRALLRAGAIDGVSVMVSEAFDRDRARRLRAAVLPGEQQVGLHFNLTEPMPGIAPMGRIGGLVWAGMRGRLDPARVAEAFARQFEMFAHAFGRAPDFIDGHQHVHVLPGAWEGVLAAAAELMPADRNWWIRSPAPASRARRLRTLAIAGPKAVPILRYGLRARAAAKAAGIATNDDFDGIMGLRNPARAAARLAATIAKAPRGCVVMCHPGLGTARAGIAGHPNATRAAEAKVLERLAAEAGRAGG